MTESTDASGAVDAGSGADGRSASRRWGLVILGLAVPVVAVILFWFQPQKLLIDDEVVERSPVVAASASDDDPSASAAASGRSEAEVLVRGEFVSLDHGTQGSVQVLALPGGTRVLRLEALATDNGPDLFVYLSTNPPEGPEASFDDGSVNLGRLKGNRGDQNYEIPDDVALAEYASVVIWCDRFDSAFGAAALRSA